MAWINLWEKDESSNVLILMTRFHSIFAQSEQKCCSLNFISRFQGAVTSYNNFHLVAFVGEASIRVHHNHIGTLQVDFCALLRGQNGLHGVAVTSDSLDLQIILEEVENHIARLLWCTARGSNVFPLRHDVRLHLQHRGLKTCMGWNHWIESHHITSTRQFNNNENHCWHLIKNYVMTASRKQKNSQVSSANLAMTLHFTTGQVRNQIS